MIRQPGWTARAFAAIAEKSKHGDLLADALGEPKRGRTDLAQFMAVACPMCNSRWPKIIAGPNGEQVLHQSPETKEFFACMETIAGNSHRLTPAPPRSGR